MRINTLSQISSPVALRSEIALKAGDDQNKPKITENNIILTLSLNFIFEFSPPI